MSKFGLSHKLKKELKRRRGLSNGSLLKFLDDRNLGKQIFYLLFYGLLPVVKDLMKCPKPLQPNTKRGNTLSGNMPTLLKPKVLKGKS